MRPAKGTLQCEREDEQEHKQNHMDVHEAFSRLKMSRRDRFLLRSKNKDRLERLSSGLGKKDELSTTNNGSTTRMMSGKRCGCQVAAGIDQGGCTTSQNRLATSAPYVVEGRAGSSFSNPFPCVHPGSGEALRVAVTKKVRGMPNTERERTGSGQRPKCAPSSPGCTTVALQPRSARKVSG